MPENSEKQSILPNLKESDAQSTDKGSFKRTFGRVSRMALKVAEAANSATPYARIHIPGISDTTKRDFDLVRGGGLATTVAGAALTISGALGGGESMNVSQADAASGIRVEPIPSRQVEASSDNKIDISSEGIKALLKIVPEDMREDAKTAIPLIEKALKDKGIYTDEVFAFALGVVEHESMFAAMEEINGEEQAEKYDYDGGIHGYGYIQFTGFDVLSELSERMGMDFVNNPQLLLQPEISAKALAVYFDYKGTAKFASKGEFLEAYGTINPGAFESSEEHIWRAPYSVEQNAKGYLNVIKEKNNYMTITDDPLQDIIKDVSRKLAALQNN